MSKALKQYKEDEDRAHLVAKRNELLLHTPITAELAGKKKKKELGKRKSAR